MDRGYRPIELEHDPFINTLRTKAVRCQYLKSYPGISVLLRHRCDIGFNALLLFAYFFAVFSASVIAWVIIPYRGA